MTRPAGAIVARERGVALITALLVVALASVAATAMLTANNIAVRRSSNIVQRETAAWYARGLEMWAGQILRRDRENNKVDDLNEVWAQKLSPLPIEGGTMTGGLTDAQGLFNLNNLRSGKPAQMKAFQRLIGYVMSEQQTNGSGISDTSDLANAVKDWVDPDQKVTYPGGAEDNDYRGQKQPYRAANRSMESPSELLLVRGMTPKIYRALRPYITALPAGTSVNVNTAPWPVLAAVVPSMSADRAKECVKYRANNPFKNVDQFLSQPECVPGGSKKPKAGLDVKSHFFLAVGHAEVGDGRVTLYSLLQRQNNGLTRVIAHSFGAAQSGL